MRCFASEFQSTLHDKCIHKKVEGFYELFVSMSLSETSTNLYVRIGTTYIEFLLLEIVFCKMDMKNLSIGTLHPLTDVSIMQSRLKLAPRSSHQTYYLPRNPISHFFQNSLGSTYCYTGVVCDTNRFALQI